MKPAAEMALECLRLSRNAPYHNWQGERPRAIWVLFGALPLLNEGHQEILRTAIVAGSRVTFSPTCVDGLGAVYASLDQLIDELEAEAEVSL